MFYYNYFRFFTYFLYDVFRRKFNVGKCKQDQEHADNLREFTARK